MRNDFLTWAATLLLACVLVSPADASRVQVSHSFCGTRDCHGGNDPIGLVGDSLGSLYGTTYFGGKEADGTIFELTPDGTSWSYKVLHDFCVPPECKDSFFPSAAPIIDVNGNLYGTTLGSGSDDFGVVYRLSPNADRTHWAYKVLYRFAGYSDGLLPYGGLSYAGQASGLPYDGVSPLYGTTSQGGSSFRGSIYRLTPNAGASKWRYNILHQFCLTDCADGALPYSGVVAGKDGSLYGTTSSGGANSEGTVFALVPGKGGKNWSINTLYSFCAAENCSDGSSPYAPVTLDSAGNLFGTTQAGPPCSASNGCGVVFKLSENAGAWHETVLHTFCAEDDCTDGVSPSGPLILDGGGDLYGTTSAGGLKDGVLFRLGKTFRVVHNFCSACGDGGEPNGIVLQASGIFAGTAVAGGKKGGGTVFEFRP